MMLLEEVLECSGRKRPAKVITLDFVAAVLAQESKLIFSFHAFGDDRKFQRMRHGNDCMRNRRIVGFFRNVANE